jgi:FAD/FMN-containing dehydrogenase
MSTIGRDSTGVTMLSPHEVDRLRSDFRGQVILPTDTRYDRARQVWNAMPDRHPALIAMCTGVADIVAALRLATETGLPVSVRGGGHNVAGTAVGDDAVVIDLSSMRGIRVDPVARTAVVQGGALWGDLDRDTQLFGLATTGGFVSTTGVAGLTLGGGIGWLARRRGLACDNLVSADVVLADGTPVTADTEHHPELLWGLRGGGGNFGIVTSLTLSLHPLGPTVLSGPVIHRFADLRAVLRAVAELTVDAPDDLTVVVSVFRAPADPAFPVEVHGELVTALVLTWTGPIEDGEQVLAPLRAVGKPIRDLVAPINYLRLQSGSDAAYPPGLQNYWKSALLPGITDSMVDALVDLAPQMPESTSSFYLEQLGGAIARVAPGDTAFAHRDAAFDFTILGQWADPADSDANVAWIRALWQAVEPSTSGVYVNNLGGEGTQRVVSAYDDTTWQRLLALKDRYDAHNVFRFNQNVHRK